MHESRSAGRSRNPARLLLISAVTLLVAACSSPAAATPTESEAATASSTVAATPEVTPTEEATPTPAPPGMGTKVQVGDEQYVTVTEVESWPGSDTQQPAAGNVFQSVKVRIDAITTTSFTSEDFTVRDSDGMSYSDAPPGRTPHLSFQNGMTPNTYWEAFVTFEVPAVEADDLTLVYSPDFVDAPVEIELF